MERAVGDEQAYRLGVLRPEPLFLAAGEVLQTPLPGAGKSNPLCAGFKYQEGEVIQRVGLARRTVVMTIDGERAGA